MQGGGLGRWGGGGDGGESQKRRKLGRYPAGFPCTRVSWSLVVLMLRLQAFMSYRSAVAASQTAPELSGFKQPLHCISQICGSEIQTDSSAPRDIEWGHSVVFTWWLDGSEVSGTASLPCLAPCWARLGV